MKEVKREENKKPVEIENIPSDSSKDEKKNVQAADIELAAHMLVGPGFCWDC